MADEETQVLEEEQTPEEVDDDPFSHENLLRLRESDPEKFEQLKRTGTLENASDNLDEASVYEDEDEEGFQPVDPSDPRFQSIDRKARAEMHSGLRALRTGELEMSEEMRAELEELAEQAEALPQDQGSRYAQQATAIVDQAYQEMRDAIPFGEVRTTNHRTTPDGRVELTEVDRAGKRRTTVFSPDQAPQSVRSTTTPWDNPAEVGVDDFEAMDIRTQYEFARANRAEMARLRLQASAREE